MSAMQRSAKWAALLGLVWLVSAPAAAEEPWEALAPASPCQGAADAGVVASLPRHYVFEADPSGPAGAGQTAVLDPRLLRVVTQPRDGDDAVPLRHPSRRVLIEAFPLEPGRTVTLDLHRFSITGPDAQIVLGQPAGQDGVATPDIHLPFDEESVLLLRGRVLEHAHSRVFLAHAEALGVMGIIELAPGEGRYFVSSRGP